MPDASITSTESTFGTISGTFTADQSTISGTVYAITGTVDGSVGVPGPQGQPGPQGPEGPPGPPGTGGTWGSIVGTLSNQTDLQNALDAKQSVSGMSAYLTKAGNLTGLTDLVTARDNLQLGLSNQVEFFTVIANTGTTTTIVGDGLEVFDGVNPGVQVTKTGIRFDDLTVQTTAYPGPAGATTWGSIVGTLSNQTDLQTALDGKYSTSNPAGYITSSALSPYLTSATAASTYQTLAGMSSYLTTSAAAAGYYPLTGNPSGFLTAASLSGYATESWVTGQGYITSAALTPYLLSSTAASTYYPLTGNPSGFLTSASLSGYALLSGATFTGTLSAPTPSPGTDSTVVATTEWVKDLDYAPLNSPQFIGNPRAPTPILSDDDTSIATTEFVKGQGYLTSASLTGYATESWVSANFYSASNPDNFINAATADTLYYPISNPSLFITAYQGDLSYLKQSYNLSDLTDVSAARTNLGLGTMATATAADYSTTTVANGLYYPLSSNPSGYLTSAPVTSVAGKTGAVTLVNTDISGLGTIATVNDAPSDGSTYGRNNGAWVVAGGGGGSSTDYQAFTTAGTFTWTKPAGAKWVEVMMFGGGGGGGSGERRATTLPRNGGAGGSAAGFVLLRIPADVLGSTESVIVGAGGSGGASVTTDNSTYNFGSNGGYSRFFTFTARGGSGGTTSGGAGVSGWFQGTNGLAGTGGGAPSATTGTNGASLAAAISSFTGSGAGGGGGAAASSTVSSAGGNGGSKPGFSTTSGLTTAIGGGAGGTTTGTLPTQGSTFLSTFTIPTGSGGGAYRTAQAGMNGANGAFGGGGGGGGSASDNGFPSGAGGAGGGGAVYIITYC